MTSIKAQGHPWLSTGQCCYSVYLEDITIQSKKQNTAYVAEVLDHKKLNLKCSAVFYTMLDTKEYQLHIQDMSNKAQIMKALQISPEQMIPYQRNYGL